MSSEQITLDQSTTTKRGSEEWRRLSWEEKKQRRLKLDEYACCNCGRSDLQLHVHHIFPDGAGGTDNIKNLRTFCHNCHSKAHSDTYLSTDFSQKTRDAPYVPMVDTLREFIAGVAHPRDRCVILLLAKTGLGVAELTELDLSDLRIRRNPLAYSGIGPRRPRVPNHFTIPASKTEGIPGPRGARMMATKVPLDRELVKALRVYLHIRPDDPPSADSQPLFLTTFGKSLSHDSVHNILEKNAREAGLYETGAGGKRNLTPQTLYHFFKERYFGQPAVRDYILGDRDAMPMRFDRLATDFREGSPSLVS